MPTRATGDGIGVMSREQFQIYKTCVISKMRSAIMSLQSKTYEKDSRYKFGRTLNESDLEDQEFLKVEHILKIKDFKANEVTLPDISYPTSQGKNDILNNERRFRMNRFRKDAIHKIIQILMENIPERFAKTNAVDEEITDLPLTWKMICDQYTSGNQTDVFDSVNELVNGPSKNVYNSIRELGNELILKANISNKEMEALTGIKDWWSKRTVASILYGHLPNKVKLECDIDIKLHLNDPETLMNEIDKKHAKKVITLNHKETEKNPP
jgi:hypothetical protein